MTENDQSFMNAFPSSAGWEYRYEGGELVAAARQHPDYDRFEAAKGVLEAVESAYPGDVVTIDGYEFTCAGYLKGGSSISGDLYIGGRYWKSSYSAPTTRLQVVLFDDWEMGWANPADY